MISAAGMAAITSMPITSTERTPRRQRPSVRSATSSAIPTTTESFANSEGWIDMPPSWIHDREPLTVEPATSTSASPTIEPT